MAVRNFWSLKPGEAIFADELQKRYKDILAIYFPLKDVGIDLLGVTKKSGNQVTFQIKESRYYDDNKNPSRSGSWHKLSKKKFEECENLTFYVFIIYLLFHSNKRKNRFETHFIIIPKQDLSKKIEFKTTNKDGTFDFYFHIDGEKQAKKVTEHRESGAKRDEFPGAFDYSKYLDAWPLINEFLK